jgi:hypothetical protein
LSDTQPDLGVAKAPVEVHLYVDGRLHAAWAAGTAEASRAVVLAVNFMMAASRSLDSRTVRSMGVAT